MPTSSLRILLIICLVAVAPMSGSAEDSTTAARIQWKPFDELSHQDLTPLGERVLEMDAASWIHGECEHFVIHGTDERLITKAAQEAEYSYEQCDRYFGPDPSDEKAHIFIVKDSGVWAMLLAAGKWPHISLALHLVNDVFILRDGKDPFTYIKIPHELVHLRVRRVFGGDCPFWAEEGAAEQLGWRMADRYNRFRYGRALIRTIPAIPEETIVSWDELSRIPGYPDDPQEAKWVERQIQRMGKALLERVGEEQVPLYLRTFLGDKAELAEGMQQQFQVSADELRKLEEESRKLLLVEETE